MNLRARSSSKGTHRLRLCAFRAPLLLALGLTPLLASELPPEWRQAAVAELCGKYVSRSLAASDAKAPGCRLEELVKSVGARLASGGVSAVDAQDLALVALLVSSEGETEAHAATAGEREDDFADPGASERQAPRPAASAAQAPPLQAADGNTAGSSTKPPSLEASIEGGFSDISKGQEGFAQGVDRLEELPVTERMAITGDITSGLQAATVAEASNLTSTFGRARVNFVTRAVPASNDGRFSEGYFFVQLVAAGGPFDTSPVGGPASFSPLNDVATDRSRFNEGTSRGNLYLSRAFYQQELRLGQDSIVGRVGIIDLSDFFDTNDFANNEVRQFLGSAFVNSPGFKAGISAPGFMGEYHKRMNLPWLQGLVFRTGYAASRTERAFTSPIWTGEAELETSWLGYQGKYRFGGTLGNVADVGGVRGFHLSFDQWISPRVGVYGRYALSNSGPGSLSLGPARQSYAGGAQWRFVNREDRVSAWGLGFSQAFGIETDGPLASERILETYYRWQVTDNFSLTPDFQLVLGSGGSKTQGTHLVGGMRMSFGF